MWGTIPQWITVAVVMFIALVEVTRWTGFTPQWVSAVATAVLALAALAGLVGVLVPLQVERSRRRSFHLDNIIAVVLEPIRQKLERAAAVVSRIRLPLRWNSQNGLETDLLLPLLSSEQMFAQLSGVSPEDATLHNTVYTDVKQNHYPQLLTKYEHFTTEFQDFVGSDLLTFAKSLEQQLRKGSSLPDLGIDVNGQRGCFYASLALYVFNRAWTKDCSSPLSILPDNRGDSKLSNLSSGTDYIYGANHDDVTVLNDCVESLIVNPETTERVKTLGSQATALDQKRQDLLREIAGIRVTRKLAGDCEAAR